MHVTYKKAKIYFTAQGKGNPMVLLHGFLESSHIWKYYTKALSKERQVICIDLPGHGKSGCFSGFHSMEEMAKIVHLVLQELKTAEVTLIGHSMGGYVNLEFYKKFPTMTKTIVLMNSTTREDSEEQRLNRNRASALVQKNKVAFVNMAISNLLTPKSNKKLKMEVEELKKKALKMSTKGIIAALQGMKIRTDNTGSFTKFEGTKYIIAGKEDPVLDFNSLKAIAVSSNSSFKALPGGHLSYLENRSALLNFLHFIE